MTRADADLRVLDLLEAVGIPAPPFGMVRLTQTSSLPCVTTPPSAFITSPPPSSGSR